MARYDVVQTRCCVGTDTSSFAVLLLVNGGMPNGAVAVLHCFAFDGLVHCRGGAGSLTRSVPQCLESLVTSSTHRHA